MKGNDIDIAYFYGRLEAQIEAFANAHELSWAELTERLAALLLSAKGGQVLGTNHYVPALRRQTSKVHKAARKMEVAGGTHRRAQVTSKKASTQSAYWAKMTPEERSAEMTRRRKKAVQNRKEK